MRANASNENSQKISLAEEQMPISGRATGWFFVGSSSGGMSIPWIIGQLFESLGPEWTFYVVLGDVFLGLVVLVIFHQLRPTRATSVSKTSGT